MELIQLIRRPKKEIETNKISSPPDPQFSLTQMLIFQSFSLPSSGFSVYKYMQRIVHSIESEEGGFHVTFCIQRGSGKALWWKDGMVKKNSVSNLYRELVLADLSLYNVKESCTIHRWQRHTRHILLSPGILHCELHISKVLCTPRAEIKIWSEHKQ